MFRICSRTNNFYDCAFHLNTGHDDSMCDCHFDSLVQVQSVDDKAVFVFVSDANAHFSQLLESVTPTDLHWRDLLIFAICLVASSWCAAPLALLHGN